MLLNLDQKISSIKPLVADELNQVIQTILNYASSSTNNPTLNELINKNFLGSHGKKIRPLLLLLIANAIKSINKDPIYNKNYINLAAAVELIHIASLLHDDVLDNTSIRNNQKTLNAEMGNQYAILSGDFLYSKALQIILPINNQQIATAIASTTSLMAEGEILQLSQKYNFSIAEKDYFKIINNKTAQLFAITFQIPGMLLFDNKNIHEGLNQCGLNFGIAYQILDDLSDYYSINNDLIDYNDLTEGKITLPIIFLLNNPNIAPNIKQTIIDTINYYVYVKKDLKNNTNLELSKRNHLNLLKNYILEYGCFDYAANIAKNHLNKAKKFIITFLPESKYSLAILEIIEHLLYQNIPSINYIAI